VLKVRFSLLVHSHDWKRRQNSLTSLVHTPDSKCVRPVGWGGWKRGVGWWEMGEANANLEFWTKSSPSEKKSLISFTVVWFTLKGCNFWFGKDFSLKMSAIDSPHHCAFFDILFKIFWKSFVDLQILMFSWFFGWTPPCTVVEFAKTKWLRALLMRTRVCVSLFWFERCHSMTKKSELRGHYLTWMIDPP